MSTDKHTNIGGDSSLFGCDNPAVSGSPSRKPKLSTENRHSLSRIASVASIHSNVTGNGFDAESICSAHSGSSRSILRFNSVSSNHFTQRITLVIDAVKDENIITHNQETGPIMIPDSGMNIIQTQLSRQATNVSRDARSGIHVKTQDWTSDPEKIVDNNGKEYTNESDGDEHDPSGGAPDGGYSWVIAVCCCFLSVSTWGASSCYGVFLNFFLSSDYFAGATDFDFAIIGGLAVGISQVFSPFVFIFVSYLGLKPTMIIGLAIQTLGYLLAGFARYKWQLYMTQGLMIGVSFSLVFTSGIAILPNWFYKKRALASGITVSGSGLGGIVFSLSCNSLMQKTGSHQWPYIMVAITTCTMCSICIILIQEHPKTSPKYKSIAPRPSLWVVMKTVLNPHIVLNLEVNYVAIWFACWNAAFITVLFSMSAYASSVGLTHGQGSVITAILNAGQFVGRPMLGHFSDKCGRINFSIVISLVVVVLLFAYWINATTYGSIIGFALLCGLTLGIGAVNNQPLVLEASGIELFPAAFSYLNIVVSGPLTFAEVIALKLRKPDALRPFLYCQILSGCYFSFGVLFLFLFRERKISRVVEQRKEALEKIMCTYYISDLSSQSEDSKELTQAEADLNEKRLRTYEYLLSGGMKGYFARMLYPIKA
ncbi:hypothetical protein BABINDRAFT_159682 [Babjeviella inositovora NRRL Y-12698]|uniref:Major facilitator superfamily (MFS) profile domain-containing protein n=1 Tax=Babjeviella inositovora NRRL Y-12698 TaxID=984486 RepID=A0A1E3R020_9ASCO|nr:uncharacterized protein BABINDRAFT_159682 [Babjeviella inositovora NRRL Y-12698]ODQ83248.1 hypothetical protein BABINDRAFT_159682 [Babjeviella inositovora NRRL Y-12698]